MLVIAQTQFGCSEGNVTCYCTQPRFGYGVRDCADEACPSSMDATQVIAFGSQYCEKALASVSSTPTPNAYGILTSATASSMGSMSSGTESSTGTESASSTATVT